MQQLNSSKYFAILLSAIRPTMLFSFRLIFGDNFFYLLFWKNTSSEKVVQQDLRKHLQNVQASYHWYSFLQ